jgi:hypothetical protein
MKEMKGKQGERGERERGTNDSICLLESFLIVNEERVQYLQRMAPVPRFEEVL